MGLNDSYGNLIDQILLIEHFPSLSKICSLILQEEKRGNIGNGAYMTYLVEVAAAMFVNNSNKGHTQVYNGGKGGEGGILRKKGLFVPIVV